MLTVPVLSPLWRFRSVVTGMVASELRTRYGGAVLGPVWAVLSPALLIAIYLLVFSQVMQGKLPAITAGVGPGLAFGLFLAAGITAWSSFAEVIARCQTVFIDHAALLKKATFPRLCLPAAVFASALIGYGLLLAVFLTLLIALGAFPGPGILALLPIMLLLYAIALGVGVLVGTLHVFFRDLGQLVPVALQLWFWLTPIVYPRSILPDWAAAIVAANPLTPIVEALQAAVLGLSHPGLWGLWPQALIACLLLAVAFVTFRRLAPAMADEL